MPKCAIKKYCMAYSVFNGGHTAEEVLPNRLEDAYDKVYEDEYRYWVTDQIKLIGGDLVPFDEVLIEGYDIFLRNFSGRVERVTTELFDSQLEIIADGTVAQKRFTNPYFIYSTSMILNQMGEEEQYLIKKFRPEDDTVFIRVNDEEVFNRTGEYKYIRMPYAVFEDRYYFLGHGIDWDKFYE